MADKMTKNYKVSGSGVLDIDESGIIGIICEDKGEFRLDSVLSDLNKCQVKFSFSYDEDYEEDENIDVDIETGEII